MYIVTTQLRVIDTVYLQKKASFTSFKSQRFHHGRHFEFVKNTTNTNTNTNTKFICIYTGQYFAKVQRANSAVRAYLVMT